MTALDPERQEKARRYARLGRRLWLVDTALAAAYALAWLLTGWSLRLRGMLEGYTSNPWLVIAAFAVVFMGLFAVISLPLGYYAGFVIPHRFGQSNQTFKGWAADQIKGMAIGAPLALAVVELLYLALRQTGALWWLWAAAGMLTMNVLLTYLMPVIGMPLFNKFVPLGEEHADLAARLMRLAEKAGAKVRGVYKFDMSRRTKAANAALTGLGSTRRIVLGDTLIDEFTPDEIETVLAHELGHHVHRDIPLMIAFGAFSTLLSLYLISTALNWLSGAFGFRGPADVANLPVLGLLLGAYGLVTMPVSNAFSRWRERLADDHALASTGRNEAFVSAFTRLANQNLGEVDPEPWVVWLFYSHPPLGERIEKARRWREP